MKTRCLLMIYALLLLLPKNSSAAFDQLEMYANIETVGITVSGESLPDTAGVMYRETGGDWQIGHRLLLIDDGRLAGSLLGLSENTTYEVTVSDGVDEISGSVTTQTDELVFIPSSTIYVDAVATPGGDGSELNPYQTIQEGLDQATAGTRVLVADGVYHEAVEFTNSGTEDNWIQLKAAGDNVVLDGAQHLSGAIWTPHPSAANVWFTNTGDNLSNLTYLARDSIRFYAYDDSSGLVNDLGHNDVPMEEGWCVGSDGALLYVRCLDDPAGHTWQVPILSDGISAHNESWIWIEGFTIRFYGRSYSYAIDLDDISHAVVRNNSIHGIPTGIMVRWNVTADEGNDIRIEYNEVSDSPVNEWPWSAVKGTSMEGSAIVIGGRTGAIVRENYVHHFFNGIYTGRWGSLEDPELAFDADIYNNIAYEISDDGFEPEGACINHRFRDNIFDTGHNGISLAPITHGPVWVLNSVFANFDASSFKWSNDSDGPVLIYHNTSWTPYENNNGMSFSGVAHNVTMRNNIFRSTRYAFENTRTGCTGHDWDFDNWYTTRGEAGPHFKWNNVRYDDMPELCAATGLECSGHEEEPQLVNPAGGDFTLLETSPNIDEGVLIHGINDDCQGDGPDIGAFEYDAGVQEPVEDLVISHSGNDLVLSWSYAGSGVEFSVLSGSHPDGPFEALEGTTEGASLVLVDELIAPSQMKFYIVVAEGTAD